MNDNKLEYLYRRYRKLVINTAYCLLHDYHLAEDVCQEVFIKLSSKRIERDMTPDEMERYLKIVAHRRAVERYRVISRHGEVSLEDFRGVIAESKMEKLVEYKEIETELFDALKKKNEQWYELILRLGIYDEEPEIVARDLGISIMLLRTKYHRAKKWMRKNYESEYNLLKY